MFPLDGTTQGEEEGCNLALILTQRPDTLSRHAGQISLPGGVAEFRDENLWQTALRETREELGLNTGRLRLLGRLQSIETRVSKYLIVPFVAWSPIEPALTPDPAEVVSVITVPVRDIQDPACIEVETWVLRDKLWNVCFYRLGDSVVWGITGTILADLAHRLDPETPIPVPSPGAVLPAGDDAMQ